jgi:hypothetical protein
VADHNIPPAPAVTVIRPPILGLILDVKTRWNTSYSMLKSFEDLRPAIEILDIERSEITSTSFGRRRVAVFG